MIVRKLEEIIGGERQVDAENGNWTSFRFLLSDDGMGFSFHDTRIYAGTETHIWYKHHLEAVYCVEGEGEIEEINSGKVHAIKNGTMYALNENDEHYLRASQDMRLICVFSPALSGREVHAADGSYPPALVVSAQGK